MARKQTGTKNFFLGLGLLAAATLLIVGYTVAGDNDEAWRLASPLGAVEPTDLAEPVFQVNQVTILVDGDVRRAFVLGETVASALDEANVKVGELDRVTPPPDTLLAEELTIAVTRVTQKEEVLYKRLGFREVRRPSASVNRGVTRVLQPGREGRQAQHFAVVFEDGVEVARTLVRTEVVQPEVDRIVEYGTVGTLSRGSNTLRYTKVIYVTATAYTSGKESTGKSPGHPQYGITFSGLPVQVGHIAVDRSLIPLLSTVYIEGLCEVSRAFSGQYLATDTGSAIRGNRIDIYFESLSEALRFGRRRMRLYLLER